MSRGMRVLVFGCVLGLAAIAAAFSGGSTEPPRPPHGAGPDAPAVAVARGMIDVEGGIVQLAASRDGIVREVRVEEGEHVVTGQTLAVLDDRASRLALAVASAELSEAEAALAPIEVRLEAAERERARLVALAQSSTVARKAVDEASDAARLARAELDAQRKSVATIRARHEAAEHEIDQRTIRAPSDGVIVRRLARAGDGVSTLNVTTLFWLAPSTPPVVRAEIEESFAAAVHPGMSAEVVCEGDESRVLEARVLRVGRAFGPRRITVHDPRDRSDVRVVEAILTPQTLPDVPLGQRVIVRFRADDASAANGDRSNPTESR